MPGIESNESQYDKLFTLWSLTAAAFGIQVIHSFEYKYKYKMKDEDSQKE